MSMKKQNRNVNSTAKVNRVTRGRRGGKRI